MKQPYAFYLEQGTHIISMVVDQSRYQNTMKQIDTIIAEINQFLLQLKKMTGGSIDRNCTWEITDYFPEIMQDMGYWEGELLSAYEEIRVLSEKETKVSILLRESHRTMQRLVQNPNDLPNQLSALRDGGSSVVAGWALAKDFIGYQPLAMDQFYLHGDTDLPTPEVAFGQKLSDGFARFMGTFQNLEKQQQKQIQMWR